MSILRLILYNYSTSFILMEKQEQEPIKMSINDDFDRPPELPDKKVPLVIFNTGARNRLVAIEERQDRVREAGEKRLSNLDLIRQMNSDVSF